MRPDRVRRVAADTSFLFPLLYAQDTRHEMALQLADEFSDAFMVTTDGVLSELLSLMSKQSLRPIALAFVDLMWADNSRYEVVLQTEDSLRRGIARYRSQTSGSPSLVDCMLMNVMDERRIRDVLAFDRDFRHVGLYNVHPSRDWRAS